jgi:hypothetical protein
MQLAPSARAKVLTFASESNRALDGHLLVRPRQRDEHQQGVLRHLCLHGLHLQWPRCLLDR